MHSYIQTYKMNKTCLLSDSSAKTSLISAADTSRRSPSKPSIEKLSIIAANHLNYIIYISHKQCEYLRVHRC